MSIYESMRSNFHVILDASEHYFFEIAKRTKHYTINYTLGHTVLEYKKYFKELCNILAKYYKTVIIIDENENLEDVVDNIAEIYFEHD
jgi:thymidylate kinase